MTKLQSLTHFLKTNLPERVCQVEFTSEMDEIQFIRAHKDLGLHQYQMMIRQCDALISWGRFPYREIHPDYIPLLIDAWASEQDNELGDSNIVQEPPSMTVDVDDETAVVIVSISFSEPVVMKEDPHGIVPFDGKRWSIANTQIGYAEHAEIYSDVKHDN
ncbi:phage tail protein [Providencia alcalifaciens]|uniref:phage tail protein n=1 Tax=Providencia alcalifaciens TaxID=126385 RepID=UPI0012B5AD66|nr:phage tail protein [Providencia alcalifaciens]MTC14046.1 phage tail protein [Providencia alcalifaciens]